MKKHKKIFNRIICIGFTVVLLMTVVRMIGTYVAEKKEIDSRLLTLTLKGIKQESSWSVLADKINSDEKTLQNRIDLTEDVIASYCTTSCPGTRWIHGKLKQYRKEVLSDQLHVNGGAYCIYPNIIPKANQIQAVSDELAEMGIPVIYLITPWEPRVDYYHGKTDFDEWSHIMCDEPFAKLLRERGVRVIDFALDTDLERLKFDPSTHWLPSSALYAVGETAAVLNNEYGFEYDLTCFDNDQFYDLMVNYPEAVATANQWGHDFDMLVPNDDGYYEVVFGNGDYRSGSYIETFISDKSDEWNMGYAYNGMYYCTEGNYVVYNAEAKNNQDKTIMVVGNSFAWPFVPYLSMDTGTVVHESLGDVDVVASAEKYDVDAVIYCVAHIFIQ